MAAGLDNVAQQSELREDAARCRRDHVDGALRDRIRLVGNSIAAMLLADPAPVHLIDQPEIFVDERGGLIAADAGEPAAARPPTLREVDHIAGHAAALPATIAGEPIDCTARAVPIGGMAVRLARARKTSARLRQGKLR